jgi:homoserine dehydrogenase
MKKRCVPYYEEALKSTQKVGYAEADTSFNTTIDTATNSQHLLLSLGLGES